MKNNNKIWVVGILLLIGTATVACSSNDDPSSSHLPSESVSQIEEISSVENSLPDFQIFNTEEEIGFIRPDGRRIVLPEKYDEIYPFSENRSVVKKDDKYGFIDDEGNLIIGLEYDFVKGGDDLSQPQFSNGRLEVTYHIKHEGTKVPVSKIGIIGTDGKYIIHPIYNKITLDKQTGLYQVKDMYRKYGYLTTGGEVVVPIIYDYVSYFDEMNQIRVEKDRKWGILNDKNEVMVPIEYDNIGEFNEDGFAVASTAFIGFAAEDRGLMTYNELMIDGYITANQIINREGKVLYDVSDKLILVRNEEHTYERIGIYLKENGTAEVPILDGLKTTAFDINGYWGQPEYAKISESGNLEETLAETVYYGQFKNEPIYEVIVWDDTIPYELIDLK